MDVDARMVGFAMLGFALPCLRDRAALRRFRDAWCAASDVIQHPGDRRVQAAQLLGFAEIAVNSALRLRPMLATATMDIEWNGQELGPQP
jgi:hypothetical protein